MGHSLIKFLELEEFDLSKTKKDKPFTKQFCGTTVNNETFYNIITSDDIVTSDDTIYLYYNMLK